MFYVYILRSAVTSRFYIGSTQDLQARLLQHNAGASKATRHGVPWTLLHSETFATRTLAVKRERLPSNRARRACRFRPPSSRGP